MRSRLEVFARLFGDGGDVGLVAAGVDVGDDLVLGLDQTGDGRDRRRSRHSCPHAARPKDEKGEGQPQGPLSLQGRPRAAVAGGELAQALTSERQRQRGPGGPSHDSRGPSTLKPAATKASKASLSRIGRPSHSSTSRRRTRRSGSGGSTGGRTARIAPARATASQPPRGGSARALPSARRTGP